MECRHSIETGRSKSHEQVTKNQSNAHPKGKMQQCGEESFRNEKK